MINFANKLVQRFGYKLEKSTDMLDNPDFIRVYNQCKNYTMTSVARMYGLFESMNYVINNHIPGDFVECGVWRGGSSMMMALMLQQRGMTDRKIYLYDTFEGMSEPSEMDKTTKGVDAAVLLKKGRKENAASVWCYSPLEQVEHNLHGTGYPKQNLVFVSGKVEDTLLSTIPGKLALLRLDTDWYESTKIELEVLYPLLVDKGVLIIDDFGYWEGAKKAVLEYFEKNAIHPLLQRLDHTGRLMIK